MKKAKKVPQIAKILVIDSIVAIISVISGDILIFRFYIYRNMNHSPAMLYFKELLEHTTT